MYYNNTINKYWGDIVDNNIMWVNEKRINRVIDALRNNNMEGYYINTNEELIKKIRDLIPENSVVACGGSMTLFETNVIEFLRRGKYNFLDRYKEGLTQEEIKNIYRAAFSADVYLTSSNAVTEEGELYNVDGNGNRVAAMLYGPDKVIVVIGVNKIVSCLEEAIQRSKNYSAPANAKRLNRNTPCAKVGYCMECNSEDRICNEYTLIRRQGKKGRIHVLILNDNLGY